MAKADMTPTIHANLDIKNAVIRDEPALYDSLNTRFRELRDHRMPLVPIMKEAWQLTMPQRELYAMWYENGYHNKTNYDDFASKVGERMHDSTASSAIRQLSKFLQGYVVAQHEQWFHIGFPRPEMMDLPGAREWAMDVEWILYDRLAKSNFYSEISPTIADCVCTGTASMYRTYMEDTGIPVWNTLHPLEVFVDVNDSRKVDTVFRLFNLTKRQAIEKFGHEKLSEEIMNPSVDSTCTFRFVHAVFPRRDTDPKIGLMQRAQGSILSIDAPWISIYFELDEEAYGQGSTAALHQANATRGAGSPNDRKKIISVGGYRQMPYSIWRWDIDPSTPYGMSPTREMLPLIKDLQFFGEMIKEETVLHVRPPLNVPASQQGKARITPRAFNYTNDVNAKIEAIERASKDYPVAADREENLRNQVREGYDVDTFMLLSSLTAQGDVQTATHVMELQTEKNALLGAIKRNMGPELLASNLRWMFHQEARRGQIPPIPESLRQYRRTQQGGFVVQFVGPLAQAQKRIYHVKGPLRILEAAMPLLQLYPMGWDVLNVDKILADMFRNGGMPADSVYDPETVAEMRRIKAERAAQQQMIDDMGNVATAMRNANTVPGGAAAGGGQAAGLKPAA